MEAGPSTYRPDVPLTEMLEQMGEGDFELAFVTDPEGVFIGTARKADIEAAARRQSQAV
jgi:hypothetical protein